MLLVMDAGNSQTVLGLYDGDALCAHWRLMTQYRTADELRLFFSALLRQEGFDTKGVDGCCISSVVPQLDAALEQAARDTFGIDPLMIGPGVKTGLVLQVENPKEIGADRIANCVAGFKEYGGPLIVLDFGTATTFDAVTERGEYKGGAIIPGIQLSADALFERCAKLPRADICPTEWVIGKDTITHIRAGLTYGYADMVDGLVVRMADELNAKPSVIATGGFSSMVSAIAKRIERVDPWLTLKGLRIIFFKNQRNGA